MDKIFHFNNLRTCVNSNNQIILQGFCVEWLTEDKVSMVVQNNGERLVTDFIVSNAPMEQRRLLAKYNIVKKITMIIDVPKEYSRQDKFEFGYIKDDEFHLVYSFSGDDVGRAFLGISYNIDSVDGTENGLFIRGWVYDYEDVSISLLDDNDEAISYDIERFVRSDVMNQFDETKDVPEIGFKLNANVSGSKFKLVFATSTKNEQYLVRLSKASGQPVANTKSKLLVMKVMNNLKKNGIKDTMLKIKLHLGLKRLLSKTSYKKWLAEHAPTEKDLDAQKNTHFDYEPLFSIIVPLYETDKRFLDELIASVKNQTYAKWELCFSDGSKDSKRLKDIIGEYSKNDKRIKYIADKKGPLGIADNTNQAYEIATGEYIVLGDHDDLFTPDALFECAKALNEKKAEVIYTDEDKIDEKSKTYFSPNFKPDFNIDLLTSNNYICHMFVAAKSLIEKVGLFRKEFDGAQDYDFVLRCVEEASYVHHIPKVLYHWRTHKKSTAENPESKLYAFEAGMRAIVEHYKRVGLDACVTDGENYGFYKTEFKIKGEPLVSIVIPNKDHIDDLKKCMDSIDNKSIYRNYEYIIIENNSTEAETFEYYKQIENRDNVTVLYWDKEFNYSAINNFGVKHAKGEYILLLNNDTEIINEDCISQMLGYCQREDVGIVGARLYYEDGTIQHAGVVIGFGGIAGHAFVTLDEKDDLYQSRTKVACDYSAVTAACLMTKKSIFEEVGGLEESYKVAFNDIDFCMKVRKLGKLVVYNANAKLYHYESKSRGAEDTPEKIARFNREVELFDSRWSDILINGDPYYNVNLTLDKADFSLR